MATRVTLQHRRPRVTLHPHAELYVQAADVAAKMPDERFEPGVDELRGVLEVREDERLECWLLVDRSGSVLFDRDELQQVALAWHFASFDSERDRVGILGFCGFGDYVQLFEFKAPAKKADQAILLIADCGGGGTPTAEAVRHAVTTMRSSTAEHKLVVVVTDAPANDAAQCAQAVRAATSEGVRVIGALKPENRHPHPGANHSAFMGEQFGSDWFEVESYTQTAPALLEHLARMPGSGNRAAHAARPASEGHVPTEHERLLAVAAEALLALGDGAAAELSERIADASDPQLRAISHYLRMRRAQLHSHGDELLDAALKEAGSR